MTKLQIIAALKKEYSLLTKQVNDEIVELDQDEYETTIASWADVELAKLAAAAAANAQAEAKTALLERLGITQAEADLLLN